MSSLSTDPLGRVGTFMTDGPAERHTFECRYSPDRFRATQMTIFGNPFLSGAPLDQTPIRFRSVRVKPRRFFATGAERVFPPTPEYTVSICRCWSWKFHVLKCVCNSRTSGEERAAAAAAAPTIYFSVNELIRESARTHKEPTCMWCWCCLSVGECDRSSIPPWSAR